MFWSVLIRGPSGTSRLRFDRIAKASAVAYVKAYNEAEEAEPNGFKAFMQPCTKDARKLRRFGRIDRHWTRL
jgi:hypothetical protein